MNDMCTIGFGTDATLVAGYAIAANERLGKIDLVVSVPTSLSASTLVTPTSNVNSNALYLRIKGHDGVTAPSGYYDIAGPFTIAHGGTQTIPLVVSNKKIGFFGSGNVRANIGIVIRNKSALAGGQVDLVTVTRTGWGYQDGFNIPASNSPGWPTLGPGSVL